MRMINVILISIGIVLSAGAIGAVFALRERVADLEACVKDIYRQI